MRDLVGAQCKFLIFAHHQEMLDGIEDECIKLKVGYMRIDGSTDMAVRHSNVNSFQNDPKILVAALSLTAAGTGLTLTAASTVVFAEMHWTPGVMIQAEDRAHRIGQDQTVNIH